MNMLKVFFTCKYFCYIFFFVLKENILVTVLPWPQQQPWLTSCHLLIEHSQSLLLYIVIDYKWPNIFGHAKVVTITPPNLLLRPEPCNICGVCIFLLICYIWSSQLTKDVVCQKVHWWPYQCYRVRSYTQKNHPIPKRAVCLVFSTSHCNRAFAGTSTQPSSFPPNLWVTGISYFTQCVHRCTINSRLMTTFVTFSKPAPRRPLAYAEQHESDEEKQFRRVFQQLAGDVSVPPNSSVWLFLLSILSVNR